MFRVFVLLLTFAVSPALFAKGYSPAVTARAGGYDVKFSPSGQPIAVPPVALPAGGVAVNSPVEIPLFGGLKYPLAASAAITALSMGGPWGAAIAAGLTLGSIGVAALDAALSSAQIRFKPGGGSIQKSDASACTVAPCYEYRMSEALPWVSSKLDACTQRAIDLASALGGSSLGVDFVDPECQFKVRKSDGEVIMRGGPFSYRTVPPSPSVYADITASEAVLILTARAPTQAEVQAMIDLNFPPIPELPALTGPASVFKGNVVQLGLDGTVKEIEERYVASFGPGVVIIGVEKKETVTTPEKKQTVVTTNPDGSQSTSVITSPKTSSTLTTAGTSEQPVSVCGLPGTPACKIDETGTPEPVLENKFKPLADKNKADADAARETIAGKADKPFFAGWSDLFITPPIAACSAFELPRSMGFIDPCPVADGMRSVMAWIWAAGGLFLCLGMIKKVV